MHLCTHTHKKHKVLGNKTPMPRHYQDEKGAESKQSIFVSPYFVVKSTNAPQKINSTSLPESGRQNRHEKTEIRQFMEQEGCEATRTTAREMIARPNVKGMGKKSGPFNYYELS